MSDNAFIAVVGLCGSVIVVVLQYFISRYVVRSETMRLQEQMFSEFHRDQFTAWQCRLQDVLSELLTDVDPQCVSVLNTDKIIRSVMKAQLMLSPEHKNHKIVNSIINDLVMYTTGWHGQIHKESILKIQAALIEESRKLFYLPVRPC